MLVLNMRCLAGSSIEESIKQAKFLALTLPIAAVEFNFNGVRIFITQNSDIEEHIEGYYKEIKNDL